MGLCSSLAWSGMLFVVALFLVFAHCIRPIAASEGIVPCRAIVIIVVRLRPPTSTGAAAAETQLLAELVRHCRLVRAGVAGRGTSPAAPAAPTAASAAVAAASAAPPAPSAAAAALHGALKLPASRGASCC